MLLSKSNGGSTNRIPLLLESKIGQQFDILVTRAVNKGTKTRLLDIPIDGKSMQEFKCLDESKRVHKELSAIDVECGLSKSRKWVQPDNNGFRTWNQCQRSALQVFLTERS